MSSDGSMASRVSIGDSLDIFFGESRRTSMSINVIMHRVNASRISLVLGELLNMGGPFGAGFIFYYYGLNLSIIRSVKF